MIGLGFVAAKYAAAQKETEAKLLIYIIAPAVVFYGTYTAHLDWANLSLPVLFSVIACILYLLFLKIGKRVYDCQPDKNILAFAAGSANAGYFRICGSQTSTVPKAC